MCPWKLQSGSSWRHYVILSNDRPHLTALRDLLTLFVMGLFWIVLHGGEFPYQLGLILVVTFKYIDEIERNRQGHGLQVYVKSETTVGIYYH